MVFQHESATSTQLIDIYTDSGAVGIPTRSAPPAPGSAGPLLEPTQLVAAQHFDGFLKRQGVADAFGFGFGRPQVLMPTTFPKAANKGPPLLPALIGAVT